MSYLDDRLERNEKIVYKASVSVLAYISTLLAFAVTMYPAALFRLMTTQLALTDKRLIGKTGVFGGTILSLYHAHIESISVQQGPLGKMLDYGTVIITGKDGTRIKFKGIAIPIMLQQEVQDAVEIAVLGRKLSDFGAAPEKF